MPLVNLKRLLSKKSNAASILTVFVGSLGAVCVQDGQGNVLLGEPLEPTAPKASVKLGDDTLGWVTGTHAELVADLLVRLAAGEAEKKMLGVEVLGLYREINMLYKLSEKLALARRLDAVASEALAEAKAVIHSTDGVVLMWSANQTEWKTIAAFGNVLSAQISSEPVRLILDRVIQKGNSEIVNGVQDDFQVTIENPVQALVCAPVKPNQKIMGVIALANTTPDYYFSADLKLLTTIAALTGPAILAALEYEETLRQAQAREQELERQVDSLQIQLDEARKQKQVAEITETEYFQKLLERVEQQRRSANK